MEISCANCVHYFARLKDGDRIVLCAVDGKDCRYVTECTKFTEKFPEKVEGTKKKV